MFGRRSYARFSIAPSCEGVLRVIQDVALYRDSREELIAVGRQAGVIGDVLTVESAEAESDRGAGVFMQVVESRPMIVDGTVRHRLRLTPVGGPQPVDARLDDLLSNLDGQERR